MLILQRCVAFALVGILLVACGGSSSSDAARWLIDTGGPLPERLSQVGVYREIRSRAPYDDVVSYVPNHALYSNGLAKERHLYLPAGSRIEADEDVWNFPVGTVLTKTFLDDDSPVETRLLFRTEEGWDYAIYHWLPDASEAERLEGNWAEVSVELGSRERVHTLPSKLDCRTCHETHEAIAGSPVLGIGSLQTSDDLVDAGVFSERPALERVQGRTQEETSALSYFVGNCTSCHNDGDSINSAFSLYPDDALATTIDQPTETETGEGIRVVPGDPDRSVLFVTVVLAPDPNYRGPFKAMPPIGVDTTDVDVEAVLRNWIENL